MSSGAEKSSRVQPLPDYEEGAEAGVPCPSCGNRAPELKKIEAGMRLSLAKENIKEPPPECCEACYSGFERLVSKGAKLRAEQQHLEQHRLMLWRSRMGLVKQARELMERNMFSEAAVLYEKYLKILKLVYQVDQQGLTPELFKGRPHEITVVASVYWDLMRVYDAHDRYWERQEDAAKKLAEFGPFTPLFSTIVRGAQAHYRKAKNHEAFRTFLKESTKIGPRCFVATSAFEGGHHPAVVQLIKFREEVLQKSPCGRSFVAFYYLKGPGWAHRLDQMPALKPPVRAALRVAATLTTRFFNLNP